MFQWFLLIVCIYKGTSDKGPSKKRTASLERTDLREEDNLPIVDEMAVLYSEVPLYIYIYLLCGGGGGGGGGEEEEVNVLVL